MQVAAFIAFIAFVGHLRRRLEPGDVRILGQTGMLQCETHANWKWHIQKQRKA